MLILGVCSSFVEKERDLLVERFCQCVEVKDHVSVRNEQGICKTYNSIIGQAKQMDQCEALALVHDDVYIYDSNFKSKILSEFRASPEVGIIGVVGASNISSLAWWEGKVRAGQVYESRGFIDFGCGRAVVDVVDGLFMAIRRSLFCSLKFDEVNYPAYHGYDVDYCLEAKHLGYKCLIIPMQILHKTKGGYGDSEEFSNANKVLLQKHFDTYFKKEV